MTYCSPWSLSAPRPASARRRARGVADVDAGVDLADRPLLVGGVPLLDDRPHRAGVVPDDPAEPGRVVDLRGEHGERAAGGAVRASTSAGTVSARSSGASPLTSSTGPSRSGTAASATAAACPEPRCSSWTTGRRRGAISRQVLLDRLPAGADDDDGGAGAQRLGGGEHVAEQAAAAEGVQDLGRRRTHAGALPGGEDDDGGDRRPPGGGGHRWLLRDHGSPRTATGGCCAGGLGLEPRLHGSKGRRAADYPIPHPRREAPRRRRRREAAPVGEPRAAAARRARSRHRSVRRRGVRTSGRRPPYGAVGYGYVASARTPVSSTAAEPAHTRPGGPLSAPALTRPTAPPRTADPNAGLPANALGKEKGALEQVTLYVFVVVPVPRAGRRSSRPSGAGGCPGSTSAWPSASTSSPCSA